MKPKRAIARLENTIFELGFPIFVNRVSETFDLLEHTHDFYEITYVAEGHGTHYIDDAVVSVSRGDLFWIPLGVSHVFRPSGTNTSIPLIVYNCIFHSEALSGSDETEELFRYFEHLTEWRQVREFSHEFAALFENLHFEYSHRREHSQLSVRCSWLQLLIALKRKLEQPQADYKPKTELDAVLQHIHDHPEQAHSLSWASQAMQLSPRQIQRQFAERTGMSFKAYVQEARIRRSCELLKTTSYTIPEVMQYVGFQDTKHFHNLFRRKTGRTPGQYRKGED